MLQDQLIAVFVAVVAEPVLRFVKGKFGLSGSAMLLFTVLVAALGASGIVLYQAGFAGLDLDAVVALAPTIFAVGQIIFASVKIARNQ
jgi:hypothetical protein